MQDLVIRPHVVDFRCERWQSPDGKMMTAPLPAGIHGHFGPQLRRFVLAQYHQGQVTVPRLLALLRALGIVISKRQVVRLLIDRQKGFLDEARDVLRAGLSSAAWITVDDTGARHKAANSFCTQIGNDYFAWFGTTGAKNRLNFLELLRAGYTDYVINDEALAYMRSRKIAGPTLALVAAQVEKHFTDRAAWQAHLDRLGLASLAVTPDPVQIATEGALWGSLKAHGFLPNTVIVSDDAGQFNVGQHGLCWVHAERLVHKLDTFTEHQQTAQQHVQGLIWGLYRDIKVYRRDPTAQRKAELRTRFDEIFQQQTGFVSLDRLLKRLHANRAELLMVLDRPEIPLHTNGSENDIRCQVTKRKISGGTRSDAGRDCRDALLGLAKTCGKLGIAFWDYLGSKTCGPRQPKDPIFPRNDRRSTPSTLSAASFAPITKFPVQKEQGIFRTVTGMRTGNWEWVCAASLVRCTTQCNGSRSDFDVEITSFPLAEMILCMRHGSPSCTGSRVPPPQPTRLRHNIPGSSVVREFPQVELDR